jgi:hypothetical protein
VTGPWGLAHSGPRANNPVSLLRKLYPAVCRWESTFELPPVARSRRLQSDSETSGQYNTSYQTIHSYRIFRHASNAATRLPSRADPAPVHFICHGRPRRLPVPSLPLLPPSQAIYSWAPALSLLGTLPKTRRRRDSWLGPYVFNLRSRLMALVANPWPSGDYRCLEVVWLWGAVCTGTFCLCAPRCWTYQDYDGCRGKFEIRGRGGRDQQEGNGELAALAYC